MNISASRSRSILLWNFWIRITWNRNTANKCAVASDTYYPTFGKNCRCSKLFMIFFSVPDRWSFDTDPDLLSSSDANKNIFFSKLFAHYLP